MIQDIEGNTLFTAEDDYSVTGAANAQLSVKAEAEKLESVPGIPPAALVFSALKISSWLRTPCFCPSAGV